MIRTTLVRSARTKTRKGAPSKPLVGLLGLKPEFYPVILAGGRGTRFWPLSRKSFAKQLLPLNSAQSMIQETVERLLPAAPAENFWIITNGDLRLNIARQLPGLPRKQIVAEPVGRNTAGAIGLAAFILHRRNPQAVLGLFPSDQVIANEKQFRKDLQTGIALAAAGENIVVMGVRPTRAETGYGYVEAGSVYEGAVNQGGVNQGSVLRVRGFREKPARELAEQFVAARNFYWNSGMFLWSAETLVHALRQYLPATAALLEKIAAKWGTPGFEATLRRLYPKCDDKSVDYGILEPRSAAGEQGSNIYCIPAAWGWNDLGSWAAHFEHRLTQREQLLPRRAAQAGKGGAGKTRSAKVEATQAREKAAPYHDNNVIAAAGHFTLDARGNYLHAPGKFVAAIGIEGLVVVDSGDALLITTIERSQDVGKIVKHLDQQKQSKLV